MRSVDEQVLFGPRQHSGKSLKASSSFLRHAAGVSSRAGYAPSRRGAASREDHQPSAVQLPELRVQIACCSSASWL